MNFKIIAIAGLTLLAGVMILPGLGTQYGLLEHINSFDDEYGANDTDCNWPESGAFKNANVTSTCELEIADPDKELSETDLRNFEIIRFLADVSEDWNTHYQLRNNFVTANGESPLGTYYLTPSKEIEPVRLADEVDYAKNQSGDTSFFTDTYSTTFDSTTPGDGRLLIASVGLDDPTATVESATYAGEQMTQIGRSSDGAETTTAVFYMTSPPEGSNTLEFTFNAKHRGNYGVTVLEDVDLSNPIGNVKTRSSSSGGIETAINIDEGDTAFDAVSSRYEPTIQGPAQNLIFKNTLYSERDHAQSYAKGLAGTIMEWDTSDDISQVAFEVNSQYSTDELSRYYTDEFYASGEDVLDLSYKYNQSSQPARAEIQFYDYKNSEVLATVNLSELGSTEAESSFVVPQDGIYQFRVIIENGTYKEQKLVYLDARQDTGDITNVSAGKFESDSFRTSYSEIKLESLSFKGENILRHDVDPGETPYTVQVRMEALRGSLQNEVQWIEVDSGRRTLDSQCFACDDIQGYRYDVYLINEDSGNPRLDELSVTGTTHSRFVGEEALGAVRTLVIGIFLAFTLLLFVAGTKP